MPGVVEGGDNPIWVDKENGPHNSLNDASNWMALDGSILNPFVSIILDYIILVFHVINVVLIGVINYALKVLVYVFLCI